MPQTPLIRVENLQVRFRAGNGTGAGMGDVQAVCGASFEVARGEVLCLVGASGSGKSVSAMAMMGLVGFDGGQITGGRILYEDAGGKVVDLVARPEALRNLRGRDIALILQEPARALNPVLTIARQLTEALRRHQPLGRAAARARAIALLSQVRLPDPAQVMGQYPHQLSGGMQQRVVIAMALANAPRLIIADEPTTALDVTLQREVLTLLDRLRHETGIAVLLVTHDMGVVAQIGDRVAVMAKGRIVEQGKVGDVFAAPRHDETRALLAAVPRLGAGARAANAPVVPPPMLQVSGLSLRYPGGPAGGLAVRDVSFDLAAGRTLALVGESGSGKTSVARALMQLAPACAGQITLDGCDVTRPDRQGLRALRRRMQMVFQDPFSSLDPRMMLGDQVFEPLLNYRIAARTGQEARVRALFDQVRLPHALMRRYPHEVSGGQCQRVAIARALALSPRVIIADEPVSALDMTVQAQVMALLQDLQRDLGLSYLLISHDLAVVERISHDIAVMYRGRIIEKGPADKVLRAPAHRYTQALMRAASAGDVGVGAGGPAADARVWPQTGATTYADLGNGHFVLTTDCGYEDSGRA